MDNDVIRERLKRYAEGCRIPYTEIGRSAGFGEPSRYIISRFLKGLSLNADSLTKIDVYLSAKGF